MSSYSGRWHEIARLPNRLQRGCVAASVDYSAEGDRVRAVQRCAADQGKSRTYRSSGRIVDPGTNAKVRLTFAGFWSQEYWIIDHDRGAGWALVSDPKGRYLWVMFRSPAPARASVNAAVARAAALGFPTARLEFTGGARPTA
jgi:apolipoprotein D and lipocalin family protein